MPDILQDIKDRVTKIDEKLDNFIERMTEKVTVHSVKIDKLEEEQKGSLIKGWAIIVMILSGIIGGVIGHFIR